MSTITMKSLLEAGVHFGHQVRRWNPKMAKYIYGSRNNIHIIDLQKTVKELKKAYKYVRDEIAAGKTLLFIGTKKQAQESIKGEAVRSGCGYVSERWLGGGLTNFETVKKSIARLKEIEKMKEEGIFQVLSKKEISRLSKEHLRLEKALSGIKHFTRLPDMVFIIDPVQELIAVQEARKLGIPIVAVCDTNCDPDLIDHPIPGNDDAIRAVKLFCTLIADAVLEGRAFAEKAATEAGQAATAPPADGTGVFQGVPADELAKPEELGTGSVQPVQDASQRAI